MDTRATEIIRECKRQEESCSYTSTALYSWIKEVRVYRVVFIIAPIVLGSIASAKILFNEPQYVWLTGLAALLAGLFPAIFKALDLDQSLKAMSDSAHSFETLRDRFRQAAEIGATKSTDDLESEFRLLMDKMETARRTGLAIPERHFKIAQKKISDGHYNFDADKKS